MWFSPKQVAKLILNLIVAVAVALARAYPADIDDDRLICRGKDKVGLGPQIFDCIENGKPICDQIPIFPETKQRCSSCCKAALQKQKTVVIFKDRIGKYGCSHFSKESLYFKYFRPKNVITHYTIVCILSRYSCVGTKKKYKLKLKEYLKYQASLF